MISADGKNTSKKYKGKLNAELGQSVPERSGIVFSPDDKKNSSKRVCVFNIAIILTIVYDIAVVVKMLVVGFDLIGLIILASGIFVETVLYIVISAPRFSYDYLSGAAKFFVLFLMIAPVGMLINSIMFKGSLDFIIAGCRAMMFILVALFYSFVGLARKPRIAANFILSFMFMAVVTLGCVFKADFSAIEDYSVRCYYIENENNSVTITGFADYSISKAYKVPSKINGHNVTGIGARAFGSIDLDELVIPGSVHSISKTAFTNVKRLERITVCADSLEDIGFIEDCAGLKTVYMPNGLINIKEVCESVNSTNANVKIVVPKDKIDSYLKVIYEETAFNGGMFAPAIGNDEYYINLNSGTNIYVPLITGTVSEINKKLEAYDPTVLTKTLDGREYKQIGWYDNYAFLGDAYNYSDIASLLNPEYYDESSLDRGISVYLKWLPIYNIKYNNSEWEFNSEQDISAFAFTSDDDDILLLDPIKKGYSFMGWYSNAELTSSITTVKTDTAADVNIYPRFLENYGLDFELDGGEFIADPPTYYHTEMNVDLPVPTRTAYDFKGWSDGEETISKITAGMVGSKALTAVWEPTVYNILFNVNGGSSIKSIQYTIESEDIDLSEIASERSGFGFSEWRQNGSAVSSIPSGSYGNVELIAAWTLLNPETTISNSISTPIVYGTGEAELLWDNEYQGITYAYQWQKQYNGEWSNLATGGSSKKLRLRNVLETGKYRVYVTASYENQVAHTYSDDTDVTIITANYDMSGVSFTNANREYNGSAQQLAISGTLPIGADGIPLTVTYSGSATNVSDGETTITATFATTSTNYNVPMAKTAKLTITPKSATVVWTKADAYTYTGDLLIAPTAKIAGIVEEINLSVAEQNSKQFKTAGTYQFVASIIDANYALTNTTCNVTVDKADYDMSSISFVNGSKEYSGSAQQLTISGMLPVGADGIQLTVTYSGSATNVTDGETTITATFATSSINYNAPVAMTAQLTITPKSAVVSWQTEDNYVYTGSALKLPPAMFSGVDNSAIQADVEEKTGRQFLNAGKYQFVASTTNTNYKLANTECNITVDKANYDMSGVSFTNANREYNGSAQQLAISGTLPIGADGIPLTVTYSGSATNVSDGETTITATFATTSTNYNVPVAKTAKLTITPKSAVVVWMKEDTYIYTGDVLKMPKAIFIGIDGNEIQAIVEEKDGKQFLDAGSYQFVASTTNMNYTLTNSTCDITVYNF